MAEASSSKSNISKLSFIRFGAPTSGTRCRRAECASATPPVPVTCRRVGDLPDDRVVEHPALSDRRPCLGRDAVLVAVGADLVVGEVRVDLDLVDRGHGVGFLGQPVQMRRLEVRHADAAGATVPRELLEDLPGGDEVAAVERRQRPMDQEEVNVVRRALRVLSNAAARRRARGSRC